jgi:hypothetical protein
VKYKFGEDLTKMAHPAHGPGGRPPAHWPGGMPASGASSRIRNFSYSRRGPWKFFSEPPAQPLGGMSLAARSTGGKHPFPKFFRAGTPFGILIFYPLFKKNSRFPPLASPCRHAGDVGSGGATNQIWRVEPSYIKLINNKFICYGV